VPEGTPGIFVGGGGLVSVPRLIGVARMANMMFTSRVCNATDG
jgi:enoyl-CoA hydratase/carnithine racemase